MRGKRTADVLNAKQTSEQQLATTRNVAAELHGEGGFFLTGENQTYKISNPDETGDGTVPLRSGIAPREHVKSLLRVNVEHEPAYRSAEGADNLRACRFTLRAIVEIAQAVSTTSLRYE